MIIGGKEESTGIKLEIKGIEQVGSFEYLGSYLTEDMFCTKEINIKIATPKEVFNRKIKLWAI